MDSTFTRRRSSSGPAAIRTCTTRCKPQEEVSASALHEADEDLTVSAEESLRNTECAISLSESESNTSSATSPKPHSNLTNVFCCTNNTVVHIKPKSPEDVTAIQALLDDAKGESVTVTVPSDFSPHIITVHNVKSTKEPSGEGMHTGEMRYFGLTNQRIFSSKNAAECVLTDGGPCKLQYAQFYPTLHLLSSFKQTGLLALRCDIHEGMWYEVAVLRYCAEDGDDDSVEEAVGEAKDGNKKEELKDEPSEVADETNKNTVNAEAETLGEVPEPEDISATVVAETPETAAQRKTDKRRANEEARKKDNQRRMKQKKKAAAAKRAAEGAGIVEGGTVAENVKGAMDIEEDEGDVVGKDTGNEGQKANGWWFCTVM